MYILGTHFPRLEETSATGSRICVQEDWVISNRTKLKLCRVKL